MPHRVRAHGRKPHTCLTCTGRTHQASWTSDHRTKPNVSTDRIRIDRNETQNFAHLLRLQQLGSGVGTAVDRLSEAEAFCATSPNVTEMLCRTAAELLAVTVATRVGLERDAAISHSRRFQLLEKYFADDGKRLHAQAFRDMAMAVKLWSRTVHGRRKPDADAAVASLRDFFHISVLLCRGFGLPEPQPFVTPVDLAERIAKRYEEERGSLQVSLADLRAKVGAARRESEMRAEQLAATGAHASVEREDLRRKVAEAKATASAYEEEQLRLLERIQGLESEQRVLASELEALRIDYQRAIDFADRLKLDADRAALHAELVHQQLKEAKEANRRLRTDQAALASKSRCEAFELSNARIAELELQKRQAAAALVLADERKSEGEQAAARQARLITALEAKVATAAAAERLRKEQERRANRYPEQYPQDSASTRTGSEAACRRFARDVGTFFRESLLDGHGPMSPFANLSGIEALPPDPYAARYSALHPDGPCTVRILRAESERDGIEVLRAWEIERRHVEKFAKERPAGATVNVLAMAEDARPGFVVLSRPDVPTLERYGHRQSTLELVVALRFVESLRAALVRHTSSDALSGWPDCRTLGVRGREAILLEPTAIHPGNLGPTELGSLDPDSMRTLPRNRIESAWVHVLAHVLVRVIGQVPTDSECGTELRRVDAEALRMRLEHMRRAELEPIDLDALRRLAKAVASALSPAPEERPNYADFVALLRAPLQH